MKRSEKPFLVEDLAARIKDAKSIAVLDYQGLPIKEQEKLRRDLGKIGGQFQVVKNTLLKRAFNESRVTSHESSIEKGLTGPTAVVFANEDELAPLQLIGKLMLSYATKAMNSPQLKFGIFGADILDSEKLQRLAQLPGKNVLLGQLVGVLSTPLYQFVGALQFNTQGLVYMLQTKSESKRTQANVS